MLLLEFLYFNDKNSGVSIDHRYSNERDNSVLKKKDKRKIKLTLRQINQLRQQSEAHEFEEESERNFIRQMYGQPPADQAQA
jgi:hypothetical protein